MTLFRLHHALVAAGLLLTSFSAEAQSNKWAMLWLEAQSAKRQMPPGWTIDTGDNVFATEVYDIYGRIRMAIGCTIAYHRMVVLFHVISTDNYADEILTSGYY